MSALLWLESQVWVARALARQGPITNKKGLGDRPRSMDLRPWGPGTSRKALDKGSLWRGGCWGQGIYVGGICWIQGVVSTNCEFGDGGV